MSGPKTPGRSPGDAEFEALLRRLQVSHPACGAVTRSPAEEWSYGTVVGNGTQGALAFGRTADEELVLSHEELFLPLYPFCGYLPVRPHVETIRDLVLEGRTAEAQAFLRSLKEEGGFPGYNTTDPFVGACALDLCSTAPGAPAAYLRGVDFETGEAWVAWEDGAGLFHRRFFVSRADDLIVLKLSSPAGSKLDLSIGFRELAYTPPTDPRDRDIRALTVDRCEGTVSGTLLVHRMRFKQRLENQRLHGCGTLARVVATGGATRADGLRLRIEGADELLLLIRTVPDRSDRRLSVDGEAAALMKIEARYEGLLAAHAARHGELQRRCTLRMSEPAEQRRAIEILQAESSVGATRPALVEKAFAAARYGIVSSTGRLPPALQGVWTGTWKPPWSGDYTLNGNVQSMVAGSLPGNHFECMASLLTYMNSMLDDFRDNARELLGCRGFLIPWRSSTHGRTHVLAHKGRHHDFPGVFWYAGAAWFAQFYADYYLYTGDEDFFETRLKPYLLEAVAFYEDILTLERDGRYVICPDSSPENLVGPNLWMAPNPTMTIAAVKQLLRTLLRWADRLGVEPERAARWREMLAKMPPYEVGQNGALKEWCWPGIENCEAHRHASHLYPLYDGVDPEIAADGALREACRTAIDRRMDFRRPDHGGFMAFGFVQMGMAAAHLGDPRLAYECVEYLVNRYWSPAMVSQHNDCDILNMDISGGVQALVLALLLQCPAPEAPDAPWEIRLLPGLPAAWPDGELRGARCRGGFAVDIDWRDGALERVAVTSPRDATCRLVCGGRARTLRLRGNATAEVKWDSREL